MAPSKQCKGCTHEGIKTCADCGDLICETHTVHKQGQRDVDICLGCLFGWTKLKPMAEKEGVYVP